GQTYAGGWTYHCPPAAGDEARRLTELLKQRELKGGREMPKKKKPEDGANRELPKEIQEQLKRLAPPKAVAPQPGAGGGAGNPYEALWAIPGAEADNPNTQFAALALWVARRNGMPVEEALLRTERRFRNAQHQDGGWTYLNTNLAMPAGWSFPPAMTCSGLIG